MTRHCRPEGRQAGVGTAGQDTHPHRQTDVLAWALGYAARGWPVLPLHSPADGGCTCGQGGCGSLGKHPRTAHGLTYATTDPDTITGWWDRWPTANLGVATGHHFDALDLDGPGALDALALAELDLPDDTATGIAAVIEPMVSTGRGIHIYIAPPAPATGPG